LVGHNAVIYAAGTAYRNAIWLPNESLRGVVSVRIRAGHGVLVTAASVLALAGLGQFVLGWVPAGKPAAAQPQAVAVAADGIAANVREVRWIAHDHNAETGTGPGYQMPLSMMPGMPEDGQTRLAISVTVTNTEGGGRAVDPAGEFTLADAATGESWQPSADTFDGLSRLPAGNAADGVLFFDVPEPGQGERRFYIDWKHGRERVRLAVQPGQGTATHSHPS
jgi:hypothetical protein